MHKQNLPLLIPCVFVGANAPAEVRYVDVNSTGSTPPFANWATAAQTIQEAVDVAVAGDQILVTNGVYKIGGRVVPGSVGLTGTNRVAVTKPISVQSVNGPAFTVIQGYQVPGTTNGLAAIRCVYLTNAASLSGFTLTNGATRAVAIEFDGGGGGVWCESTTAMVTNCVLVGNSAAFAGGGAYKGTLNNCTLINNSAGGVNGFGAATGYSGAADQSTLNNCILTGNSAAVDGGGAWSGILNNCTLLGNSAGQNGGGASLCTLRNCTLAGNLAGYGGGAHGGTLINCTLVGNSARTNGGGTGSFPPLVRNCIVYFNTAPVGANYVGSGGMLYSCTTPRPGSGFGNITNTPLFVDTNGWANLRLQSNSPCINAGNNAYLVDSTDLDGNPRIAGGTMDIGAYEFQSPSSVLSYAWAQQYGLLTDGSEDYSDSDVDRMNNWQEWVAGTVPTDAASALRLLTPAPGVSGTIVSWQSVSNRTYFLERASDLGDQPAFSMLTSNIVGQLGTTSFTDTNAVGSSPFFYRVGVE